MANIEAERRWMAERSVEGREAERRRWASERAEGEARQAAYRAQPCERCGHRIGDHIYFSDWCQVDGCQDERCKPVDGAAYA